MRWTNRRTDGSTSWSTDQRVVVSLSFVFVEYLRSQFQMVMLALQLCHGATDRRTMWHIKSRGKRLKSTVQYNSLPRKKCTLFCIVTVGKRLDLKMRVSLRVSLRVSVPWFACVGVNVHVPSSMKPTGSHRLEMKRWKPWKRFAFVYPLFPEIEGGWRKESFLRDEKKNKAKKEVKKI